MVFVGGPRQVGKTTLAKYILEKSNTRGRYFNWDYDEDRRDIIQKRWQDQDNLLVFDELHKYPYWKNWIKGIYDVSSGRLNPRHATQIVANLRNPFNKGQISVTDPFSYFVNKAP